MRTLSQPKARLLVYGLASISLLVLGFVLGKLVSCPYLRIEPDIDPVSVASLAMSVIIALIVSRFLARANDQHRIQTQLLMGQAQGICSMATELLHEVSPGQMLYQLAVAYPTRMQRALQALKRMAGVSLIAIPLNEVNEIEDGIRDLRRLITDIPKKSASVDGGVTPLNENRVSAGRIYFPDQCAQQIQSLLHRLQDKLFELQVLMNRA
jgi:hypothetical protein